MMNRSERKAGDKWEKMPKGWTDESREKFWESLVGDVKHKVTKCIKQMEGKVGDPGAFCAALADRVEGKGWRSARVASLDVMNQLLPQKDVADLRRKADEQTYKLAVDVYMALKRKLSLSDREGEALNRLRYSVSSSNEAMIRNNVFKAADALGMKLPSMSFMTAKVAGELEAVARTLTLEASSRLTLWRRFDMSGEGGSPSLDSGTEPVAKGTLPELVAWAGRNRLKWKSDNSLFGGHWMDPRTGDSYEIDV